MNLNDKYHYDSPVQRLYSVFHPVEDGYYVNTSCILVRDNIVSTGESYVLFDYLDKKLIRVVPVVLKRVFYIKGEVILFLINMLEGELIHRQQKLSNVMLECHWELYDIQEKDSSLSIGPNFL